MNKIKNVIIIGRKGEFELNVKDVKTEDNVILGNEFTEGVNLGTSTLLKGNNKRGFRRKITILTQLYQYL